MIISRHQTVVIAICISHIPEAAHHIAVHRIRENHQAARQARPRRVPPEAVPRILPAVAIVTNHHREVAHPIVEATQRRATAIRAVRRKVLHINPMMMVMMISIWTAIMMKKDIRQTRTMQTV